MPSCCEWHEKSFLIHKVLFLFFDCPDANTRYASLAFSILATFGAVFGKQWLNVSCSIFTSRPSCSANMWMQQTMIPSVNICTTAFSILFYTPGSDLTQAIPPGQIDFDSS
ncbi:hypothetical protein EDB19DRAFT_1776757 [Suillus lakei]|nr:hypothetical protein EDB19DRAFT_1776757 [Suillus lakei]